MNLFGTLLSPVQTETPLAEIEVASDTAVAMREGGVMRTVIGRVLSRGPIWHNFFRAASNSTETRADDGFVYYQTRLFGAQLGINYDFYPNAGIRVDDNQVRIVVNERGYDGLLESYRTAVAERNRRCADFMARFNANRITNQEAAQLNVPVPGGADPTAVADLRHFLSMKSSLLEAAKRKRLAQNTVG